MSDKLSELLPCPFCGGAVVLEQTIDKRHWWGVKCRNTLNLGGTCAIEQIPSASPEAAVERWNRRVSPAPAIPADRWQPIETAPKETELLGWREDCGVLLIMHTSFDRWASEAECDDIDEETLFQKDWFGTALPGIMDRLEREQVPTHWMPLPVDPTDDALKAAPAISESEDAAPSFKSPLTPFGQLVRSLRVVTGALLGDMARAMGVSSAELSAMELGRRPIAPEHVGAASEFFQSCGLPRTAPLLMLACLAARKGEKS
ncbi:Lar family restriction alleviation protein [Burkholderia glumae]|uniref:Lar family restriction alleviation protein n=1 Tax=Burkholderia glumae TaxID=337 RepID=UPI002150B6AB|nr:Lar family restriction alleviation protein [Burkholderia glumae]